MKYLLTIGHMRVILQNDHGLATLLKSLSSARIVDRDLRYCNEGIRLTGEICQVTAEALPNYEFVKRPAEEPLAPEVMRPIRAALSAGHRAPIGGGNPTLKLSAAERRLLQGGNKS